MATISEVADLAGVSLATVSRVLNGSDKVAPKTLEKVNAGMKELGYRPNSHARSLASNQSNSIGLMLAELDGPYYGPIMAGVERALRQHHKHLLIASSHATEQDEREGIDFLLDRRCDALILLSEALTDDELIEISRQKIPVILLNRFIPEVLDKCVFLDNELSGRQATQHLIDQGHKKIACVTGPLWKKDARDRLQGYRLTLAQNGIKFDERMVVEGNFNESGGIDAVKKLTLRQQDYTAIFSCNDEMAAGIIETLRLQGIKVPEDISVIGHDDVNFAYYMAPKLSTIRFPIQEMAITATNMLLQQVYNLTLPIQNRFESEVIERNSVKSLIKKSDQ